MNAHSVSTRDVREIASDLGPLVERFAGKTILLTGGAGFLGRTFEEFFKFINADVLTRPCRLLSVDNNIVGCGREGDSTPSWNCVHLKMDVTQPLEVDEPIDYIIHGAGIASPFYYRKYPLETLEAGTTGTRNVLRLAVEREVLGILYFSSSEIYGNPAVEYVPTNESYRGNVACLGPRACYDEAKRVGETLCYIFRGAHNLDVKIVRPFNFYGPGMTEHDYRVVPHFARRALRGEPLHVYGDGSQTRTLCYVSDGIAGCLRVLLMGRTGEAYNIGNESPEISVLELAHVFERVLGRRLDVHVVGYPDAYPSDEPRRRCPDLSKATAQLGYQPRVGLEEGLARFVEWASATYVRRDLPPDGDGAHSNGAADYVLQRTAVAPLAQSS